MELASDDVEHVWGTIKTYRPWGDSRTRVELTQSNWETLGDVAEMVQGGYRHAWVAILEQGNMAACESRAVR